MGIGPDSFERPTKFSSREVSKVSPRFVLISDYFRDLIKLQARTKAFLLVMTRWLLDLSVAIPGLDAVAPNSENGGFMYNIYMVYMYLLCIYICWYVYYLYIYIHTYTCTYYVCIYSRTIVALQERHLFVGGAKGYTMTNGRTLKRLVNDYLLIKHGNGKSTVCRWVSQLQTSIDSGFS